MRKQAPPPQRHFVVRPLFDQVGTSSDDNMQMVTHHRKTQDFQTEDPSQFFQAVSNPLFAVRIVLTGPLFPAAQIRSSYTPIDEVKRLHIIRRANLRSIPSGHRTGTPTAYPFWLNWF
jgi:hypothetical protein